MGPKPNCWADASASQLYLTPAGTGASASIRRALPLNLE